MLNFMTFHPCIFLMTLKNSLHKENSFKHGQEGKVWLLIPWGISSFHESDTCKNVNTYSAWILCLPEVCLDSQTLLSVFFYMCVFLNVAVCHFCVHAQCAVRASPVMRGLNCSLEIKEPLGSCSWPLCNNKEFAGAFYQANKFWRSSYNLDASTISPFVFSGTLSQ